MIPKFRAWHKKEKKMFEVGCIHWRFNPLEISTIHRGMGLDSQDQLELKDLILMQSTGLKDKNGREIFEGDIVENEAIKDYVIFIDGVFTLNRAGEDKFAVRQPLASFGSINLHNTLMDIKIIGNIHQHSHLLKEQSDAFSLVHVGVSQTSDIKYLNPNTLYIV